MMPAQARDILIFSEVNIRGKDSVSAPTLLRSAIPPFRRNLTGT